MKVILRKEDVRMPNNYVIKLLKLLNSTKEIFECNGYRIESDTNGYNYGFHVFDKTKVELFYFGILFDYFNEMSPIHIGFHNDCLIKISDIAKAKEIIEFPSDKEWKYLKININEIIDNDDSAKQLYDILTNIIKKNITIAST